VTSIYASIFGVIRGVFTSIAGWVSGVVAGIAGSISGAFSGVVGAIAGMFAGISGAVSGAFSGVAGIVKGAVNGIIGAINGAIGGINGMIDVANKIPFVNVPHIGAIPRLHSGGFYDSGSSAGEGLALLRDRELVATPEQQATANDLLGRLLSGRLATGDTTTVGGASTTVQITENVYAAPGESAAVTAARATQGVVWNLNAGITRPAPIGASDS
jgi:phage-related protein